MAPNDQLSGLSDEAQMRFDSAVDQAAARGLGLQASSEPAFAELAWMRGVVLAEAEARGQEVANATFDRLWARVEPELARGGKAHAVVARRSFWPAWMSLPRVGWSFAGACAAAGVLFTLSSGAPTQPDSALAQAPRPGPARAVAQSVPPNVVPAPQPLPSDPSEALVERIEFGGRSGRISQIDSARGVTTVIWLSDTEERAQPKVQDL